MASPRRDNEKFCKNWFARFDKSDKAKEAWERQYEVATCKQYWMGNQYENPEDEFNQRKVQINKIHPNVRASIPTLYFHNPFARIHASPALADTPGQIPGVSIDDKAQLLQDTGNTLIQDPDTSFDESTHAALKESNWAFGCVLVVHDAVPVDNPNVLAGPLKETEDTVAERPKRYGNVLGLNEMFTAGPLVESERFYVKRIPARQVMFPADHTGAIKENSWIGYWSIHYLEDVKNSPLYSKAPGISELKSSGIKTNEDDDKSGSGTSSSEPTGNEKIKLYSIWDQRTRTKLVFADGHTKGPLLERKYKRCPLKLLRFDVDPDSAYPIPPIYHQLHPQDEFNDSREWLRKNRKGTVPRYTYDKEAIAPKDMKKLESGEMGTYIPREANSHGVIEPVPQPNYSAVAIQTLQMSKEEFVETSMVAGERKGVPQSRTATQARIIDVRSQVTESYDRITVAKWLASIVEEMILLAAEEMSLNWWIMNNADPSAAGFQAEAQKIETMWREITFEDLQNAVTGIKWRVEIEEESMSPVAETEERERWMNTMLFFQDPIMVRLMALSPELRKKTLKVNGIKSARDQELLGQAFVGMVQLEQQLAMMGGPAPKGVPSPPAGPGADNKPSTESAEPPAGPPTAGPTINTPPQGVPTGGARVTM